MQRLPEARMRAKDVAFVADVLANEARHAAPGDFPGLLAAVGALRLAIIERQPEADVAALGAVEDALSGRLYGVSPSPPHLPAGARSGDIVWVTGVTTATTLAGDGWQETGSGAFWRRVTAEDVEGAARG